MNELSWLSLGLILGLLPGLGLVWWATHPNPRRFKQKRYNKSRPNFSQELKESVKSRSIFIPIQNGLTYSTQAVEVGVELALHSDKPLHLTIFLEVPRTHNLESGLDAELETAFALLEQIEQHGARLGLDILTSVSKVRDYTHGVIDSALELEAGLIILEQSNPQSHLNKPCLADQANTLSRKIGCHVLLLTSTHSPQAATRPPQT